MKRLLIFTFLYILGCHEPEKPFQILRYGPVTVFTVDTLGRVIFQDSTKGKQAWDSLRVVKTDSTNSLYLPDSVVLGRRSLMLGLISFGPNEPTEETDREKDFIERLKSRLGPKSLAVFPKIKYIERFGSSTDNSEYADGYTVISTPGLSVIDSNVVVLGSGKKTDRYGLFVLEHELGHWIHFRLMKGQLYGDLLKEFRGEHQHIATFLGFELDKFANGMPSEIDSLLRR